MADINLLPESKRTSTQTSKALVYLLPLSKVVFVVFIIALAIYISTFAVDYLRDSTQANSQQELQDEVRVYQATEQKIVLLRDRIDKAKSIIETPSAASNTVLFQEIASGVPSEITILDSTLLPAEMVLTVSGETTKALGDFVESQVTGGKFKRIELESAFYDPDQDYVFKMRMIK